MNFDYEFIKMSVEKLELENMVLGGLMFPFLETAQIQPPRLLFAKLISTSKEPHYACFAAVYFKDGKLKPNGNWFPLDPDELAKDGLVRITYRRVRADIVLNVVADPIMGDVVSFTLNVSPNIDALLELFEKEDALRVTNKNLLAGG